jgi:hypothetical protein
MATYKDAIDGARKPLNDAAKIRYPDADLFLWAQDGIRETAFARPDLFTLLAPVTCVAGALQTVATATVPGLYVLDVQNVVGGSAVNKGDLDTLRRYARNWQNDDDDEAENWFPVTDDLAKRPQPAPAGQVVMASYVIDPLATIPASTSVVMPIPDNLLPAIESYVVFRAESIDDEHVNSGRSQAAYANFRSILGIAEKARKMNAPEGRPQ